MLPEKHGEPTLLTVKEVATYLVINQRTVYRLVKEQRLPAFRVGGQWRFKLELIDAWTRQGQANTNHHREKAMV